MSQTHTTSLIIGADIGSVEIVLARADAAPAVTTIGNEKKAIDRWLKTLPPGSMIGMEATGCYHQCLADRAAALGFTVYVLNPKDVAYYAKALGQRGKTDRLDARIIARYVAHEGQDLHPYWPPTARQREIAILLQRRAALVKHAVALEQSLSDAAFLKREARRALAALRDLVTAVERQLKARLAENPALEERRQRLQSIAGVGPLVSIALAQRFDRIAYPNSDAAVAAYGLDPRPKESGTFTGKRTLSKRGNPEERRLVYLAAVSGARTRAWQPYFTNLLAKGLSKTAAHCALARKIVRVAFAVWNSNTPFNPALLGKKVDNPT